jgi:pimeloyl-ACP methyl ester carboxylesterase
MPVVETAAGSIWYEDNRHDAALPVTLMIHGAGGAHTHFPASLRHLPEANAIIPDLPAHGESQGEGHAAISEYAADMIAFLDALKLDKVIAAGHSMGGAIALTLALDYPQRVRGLILIGTGAKLSVHPDILDGVLNEFLQVAKKLMEWQWHEQADVDLREVIGYKTLIGTPVPVVYGDYAACNAFDVRERLSEIQVPALIIGGMIDKMTPPKFSEYLSERIAHSKLVLVEDGAHMMAQEQPQFVTEAVRQWLLEMRDETA